MAETIETPCIGICTLDQDGTVCIGCLRTVAEIGAWRAMPGAARRAVMDRIRATPDRHQAIPALPRRKRSENAL